MTWPDCCLLMWKYTQEAISPGGATEGMSVTHGKAQAGEEPRLEQLLEDGTL